MDIELNDIEIRVLGSLMEKALSTPDYYPLSLNALTNACNQKSSRDPVVFYDEPKVLAAAQELGKKDLVHQINVGRVTKFEEHLSRKHNFVPRETAILCVLLLRGAQTVGEIRSRTSRLHNFQNLEEALETLENLKEWGFIRRFARMPGHKESRYAHLLYDELEMTEPETDTSISAEAPATPQRIENLESSVTSLQTELEHLKKEFQTFREQFE